MPWAEQPEPLIAWYSESANFIGWKRNLVRFYLETLLRKNLGTLWHKNQIRWGKTFFIFIFVFHFARSTVWAEGDATTNENMWTFKSWKIWWFQNLIHINSLGSVLYALPVHYQSCDCHFRSLKFTSGERKLRRFRKMNLRSLIFFYRLISLTITLGCGATTFYFYCLQLPEHKGQVQTDSSVKVNGPWDIDHLLRLLRSLNLLSLQLLFTGSILVHIFRSFGHRRSKSLENYQMLYQIDCFLGIRLIFIIHILCYL